jgi:phosphoenolpyruvate carboxykinase (ATP)
VTVPYLNLTAPTQLPHVEEGILDPRNTYTNAIDWEEKAKKLAALYIKYFEQYTTTEEGKRLVAAGPCL